jgi:hypothetical protein
MPNPELRGLVLSRSERIVVVALSYIFCAPLIYINGRRLLNYFLTSSSEAQRQEREERLARRRALQQQNQRPPAAAH